VPAIAEEYTSYYVGASPWLIAWAVLLVLALACGVVTAAKGRWGWVAIGLVTVGFLWLGTAFLPARPGSWWARRRSARAE